jgi:serine/threonine-protein kinase
VIATGNLIGTRLGNYEIQALLGSGGMASVYRGFDTNLRRPVAIKVLSDAAAAQPGLAARFRQEAQIIAGLHHPNIVKVYDFGDLAGLTYMVQELLPGPTLEQYLRDLAGRGAQIGRDDTLAIVRQLADALDAAHAAGIIHRDVKPSNALWNASGALTLTDFGIAKNTLGEANHTRAGMVIGTPNYISPEQARGLAPTPASDIYSLGVVLYELLAGKPPFEGDTMNVMMDQIQTPPPPLRQARPDLPADVETVVQQALAKDPAARFNRAAALAAALEQAWPATPAATAPADVHNQSTRLWEGKPAAPAPQPATGTTRVAHPTFAEPAPVPQFSSPRRTGRSLLPLLGGLLVLFLLGGLVLASRGARGSAATSPADSAPTALAEQAATAAPEPATAPQPTAAPAPQPTVAPAPPSTPIDQLRHLLANGAAAGQAGEKGPELINRADEVRRALAAGDKNRAADQLRELAKDLIEGSADGEVDPSFANQALDLVGKLAGTEGLTLQVQPPPPSEDGNGNGKGNGKGKGKGRDK